MRKQEIESGLPLLEDELLKTEAKLAQCREEEKKLLAEIAKGREGRLRLVEELQALGIETDGLTMEELQQAKDSFESSVAANDETGEYRMPHCHTKIASIYSLDLLFQTNSFQAPL
jgi:hypothetical protein